MLPNPTLRSSNFTLEFNSKPLIEIHKLQPSMELDIFHPMLRDIQGHSMVPWKPQFGFISNLTTSDSSRHHLEVKKKTTRFKVLFFEFEKLSSQ